MSTTQGIKLDDATSARLKALGEARERSPHWLMRAAIADYLDREEKVEREKAEDMTRWETYAVTGHAVPHDKAAAWLDDLAHGIITAPPT
jgi:predicted transcriptional regulator